jgi:hypothetical protein
MFMRTIDPPTIVGIDMDLSTFFLTIKRSVIVLLDIAIPPSSE